MKPTSSEVLGFFRETGGFLKEYRKECQEDWDGYCEKQVYKRGEFDRIISLIDKMVAFDD